MGVNVSTREVGGQRIRNSQPSLANWKPEWERQGKGEEKGRTAENEDDDEREEMELRGGREKIFKEIYF